MSAVTDLAEVDIVYERVPRWWLSTIVVHTDWESMTDGYVGGRSTDVMRCLHYGAHHGAEAHAKAMAHCYREFAGVPELTVAVDELVPVTDPITWLCSLAGDVALYGVWRLGELAVVEVTGGSVELDALARAAGRVPGLKAHRRPGGGVVDVEFPWQSCGCEGWMP